MRAFVDTNVLVYAEHEDDTMAEPARALRRAIAAHRLDATTSVLVIEELWHVELRRRPELPQGYAADTAELFGELLPVTNGTLRRAFELRLPYSLGAADRVHVASCAEHGIDTIVTADVAFDDAVPGLSRVDPLDHRAVDRLLA
ncbi:MAG: type II toxin-antitoxin system VapC family toxin [Actinomycetota bacterium]|nr:type II toxin-antitoxin system VapC family toxin [Actinomycetota bacterium]